MKQQNITKGWLTILIVIVLAGIALSFLGTGGVGAAQAQTKGEEITARWEYQVDSSDISATSAQKLNINGVAAKVQALGDSKYRLVMSGSQGTGQLRQALYSPLAAGFIGGVADIEINMPVSALKNITINLESNLTTGYQWTVVSGADFTQVGESAFAPSIGVGAPTVQTLVVLPKALGNGSVKLAYRRSFGPAETATRHLRVTLTAQTAEVDLSDPAPKVINTQAALNDSAKPQNSNKELPLKALPASLDWRTYGIVPTPRDQGAYGSCWSFGTVGIMESAIKKAGGPMTDLSEQFLISCNTAGWGDGGLTAHMWHYDTLGLNQTAIGAVLESAKPYTASKGTCTVAYNHPYILSGWQFIVPNEWTMPTVDQIKNAINTYGPITAGVCVGNAFQAYSGGIFSTDETSQCPGSTFHTNHQIILVGWNDAGGYWILRNSWGPTWGESGYMRIAYNTSRVGEGTSWVSSNSVGPTPTPTRIVPPTPIPTTVPKVLTVQSAGAYDGWVLESSEVSNIGSTLNNSAATFNLGDSPAKKQYRGILSFNTGASLPDNAVITAVTLKVQKQSIIGGGNPLTAFQGFMVDIKNGFFGTASTLQPNDFQAAANASYGPFAPAPAGNWYGINLTTAKAYVNKLATNGGLTQIRLRFKLDDNNNAIANTLNFYSGNAPAANRPQLVITYYVPANTPTPMPTNTPTRIPTRTPMPTSTPTQPAGSGIVNGNFESGATGWTEYSTHGWSVILDSSALPMAPNSGNYAAWLGGDYDDISYIEQQIAISPSAPYLVYQQWISSEDACGYDFAGVIINDSSVVNVYDLCSSTDTGGWVTHSVDLSAYAGQSVTLQIRVETDSSLNSNLFVDDVVLQANAAASGQINGTAPSLGVSTKGKFGTVPQGEKHQSVNEKRLLTPR